MCKLLILFRVGLGGVMGTMNASQEAANSGIGGWIDGFTYIAGLSGGSWGTTTFLANNGRSPLDLVDNVSASQLLLEQKAETDNRYICRSGTSSRT